MKPAVYEPRGVWEGGRVRYPDAAAVRDDFEPFLRHHIVPVVGATFPAPMEEFDFTVHLPGGVKLAAHGRIISVREGSALIRVDGWSDADLAALQEAGRPTPPARQLTPIVPIVMPPAARGGDERSTPVVPAGPGSRATPPVPVAPRTPAPPAEDRASLMDAPRRRERESVRLTTPKIDDALATSLRAAAARGGPLPSPPPSSHGRVGLRGSQAVTPQAGDALSGALRASQAATPPGLDAEPERRRTPQPGAIASPPRLGPRVPIAPDTSHVRPVLPLSNRVSTDTMGAVRPEPRGRTATDPGFAAVTPDDDIRALYEARAKGNLFDALGLHYTDPPSRIRAAYQTIVAEYRPGSPAHRRSPTYADLVVKLANQAWAVLSEKGSRRRYRREILAVDVDSAAQILASKSKFAMSRGDLAAARQLLEAAADLHPDPEYVEELRNLLAGKLPPPETEDDVEIVRPPPKSPH